MLVAGNVSGRLLKPYAMAASSMISHSCNMSGRVGGISTRSSSVSFGDTVACSDMRVRRTDTSCADKESPVQELMYDACAVVFRGERSGVMRVVPSG